MAKAPVVTELPLQNVRFLFGTMVDLRMLPAVLEQTGQAEVGEFKLVAHFPADEKAANNEAGYLTRHKGFRGGDYNTYHGDPYTLDEINWDATGRAGVHLVTKTKYGQVVEFPTIPDKNDTAELMLIVSEYVESIKTPPLIVRCSGIGGTISPLGNKKYSLALTTGATKCPAGIKDHVPKKYHAEDTDIIPHVGDTNIFSAEDLSPTERDFIGQQIKRQMQGYYRTGVIGVDPVIGAFPNGPMSIAKRTPEAKQDFFREPAVQDEDGFWNKGPNRWQAHKIAQGVAYDQLEKAREIGALTPGYRHRGRSGKFRRNPFKFGAEDDLSDYDPMDPHGEFGGLAGIIYGELAATGEVIPLMHVSNNSYDFLVNDILPEGVVHNEKGGTDDAMLSKSCALMLDMYDGLYTRCWFEPHGHAPLKSMANLGAEDYAAESLLLCSEHDDYFHACGCGTKTMNAPYAGRGSLMDIGKDTGLGSFTPGELTTSSAIHGDFDQASLNYSGHQNLEVRSAEYFNAVSTAAPNLNREKTNLRAAIREEIDPNFEYSQCVWGPYALRAEGASSNKFYIVFVYNNGKGVFRALGGYGGLAQNPRLFDVTTTRDQAQAIAAATRKLKAKERKGYFTYKSEEGNAPIQDPMEFGEMANWTPMDGTPGLSKRKRAESSFMTPDLLWENLGGYWKAVGINPEYDMGQPQGQPSGGNAGAGTGNGGTGGESEGQAQQEQEQHQEGHRGHEDSQPISPYAAESNFNKLARKISMQYQDKGKSKEEADEIGRRTAYTIGAKKYGKRGMTRKAMAGRKSAEDIPVWNDGIVEWETSGPMSPTGSGYSSASAPPTGVIAGPGDTFLNYTEAQNYLVETSGGLWGAEHFEAMARIDPKNAQDVKKVKDALKQRYKGIKINRIEYITNRKGSSNKYHVFAFTNRGVFNGYGRIGKTMTIFGPMSETQGQKKMDTKMRRGGYKEQV